MTDIKNLLDNREYVHEQIKKAREVFSSNKTTRKEYDLMESCLGYMYLHCSEEFTSLVRATLQEAIIRRITFEDIWDLDDLG